MTAVPCPACGEPLTSNAASCSRCGAGKSYVLTPEPARLRVTGYAPTIIIFGREPGSGDTIQTVQAPEAHSQARLSSSGTVSVVVEGPPGVGRPGEPRVADVLRAHLEAEGVPSRVLPGDDDRGEDRLLVTPDSTYVLQVVTVPRDPTLWHHASAGSGSTSGPLPAAAGWIEDSIQLKVAKTTPADRARMILVLDAFHAGVLTEDAVVGSYLEQYGSPTERHAFASVWLLGPTADRCVRLGAGVL